MNEPEDLALVAASQRGDPAALEQLLRRHHARVLALCRQMCRESGDAEDAAQNALIAIVRGLDSFDGRSRFSTWSHRVTANACLDELRRRSRRPVPTETLEHLDTPDHGPDPAQQMLGTAERTRLREALDELPREFMEAVLLRDVADLEYTDIAEMLGVSGGTVRSRIARGRARLARSLAADMSLGNQSEPLDVQRGERS